MRSPANGTSLRSSSGGGDVAKRSLARLAAELQGTGRPTGGGSRNTSVSRGCGPADRPREGRLVPLPVSRPGRCVLPVLWRSSKTGRTGYSPACDNEWAPGVCEKPRVRCGECPNQAFVAVSDRVDTRPPPGDAMSPASIRCLPTRRAGFSRRTSTRRSGRRTSPRSAMPAMTPDCRLRSSARARATGRMRGSSSMRQCPRRRPGGWAAT